MRTRTAKTGFISPVYAAIMEKIPDSSNYLSALPNPIIESLGTI